MLFIATCADKPDSLQLRLATRPAHLAFLQNLGPKVRAGGALLTDDEQGVLGSLLILEGESDEEIASLLADDPYAKAGLFESVDIKPWRQAIGVPLG
ncbi:MAG: YciI family protein [Hyphomicrobiales bacterium]